MGLAAWVERAIKTAGVAIESVSIGDPANKATWRVIPASLQAQAQPHIDSFNSADPAHEQAELDEQVKQHIDRDRLASAIVWTIIDTYSAPATIPKYNAARTKILAAFKSQPWKA